jgi:hypothetical protein
MLARILAVALATGSLVFATAQFQLGHAQTGTGTPASNQTHQQMAPSPETTKPSDGPVTDSSSSGSNLSHQQIAPSPETTKPKGSATGSSNQSQAQQPIGSSSFDPSQYKSKTECLNAASAARASIDLCNSKKLR